MVISFVGAEMAVDLSKFGYEFDEMYGKCSVILSAFAASRISFRIEKLIEFVDLARPVMDFIE